MMLALLWNRTRKTVSLVSKRQWMIISGAMASFVLFSILLTQSQKSQHYEFSLKPLETKIVESPSVGLLARRNLIIEGNTNASHIFLLNNNDCPERKLIEQETEQKDIKVTHSINEGRQEESIYLTVGSKVEFFLTNATGYLEVTIFPHAMSSSDTNDYEHHQHNKSKNTIFYGQVHENDEDLHTTFVAQTTENFKFRFEGRGTAKALMYIERYQYDLEQYHPIVEQTSLLPKYCTSYRECNIQLSNMGGCGIIQPAGYELVIPTTTTTTSTDT